LVNRDHPKYGPVTWLLVFGWMSVISVASAITKQPIVGFVGLPFTFLFVRPDRFTLLAVCLPAYTLFFEALSVHGNLSYFSVPDSLVVCWLIVRFVNTNSPFTLYFKADKLWIPWLLFVAYGLLLSTPILVPALDFYWFRDLKNILYLAIIPFIISPKSGLHVVRATYFTVFLIVASSAFHAIVVVVISIINDSRAITWNEIYFSDAIILTPILISLTKSQSQKFWIGLLGFLNLVGLIATQTRGLWISTLTGLLLLGFIAWSRDGGKTIRLYAWRTITWVGAALVSQLLLGWLTGASVLTLISKRMTSMSDNELIDPFSSLGYRLHESYVVWLNRTWLGHGSGAKLKIYFTQFHGEGKIINWWSIHSEYFEALHKYGYVGLALMCLFFISLFFRGMSITKSRNGFKANMGAIIACTVLNHAIVSITAGYLIRENVMIYLVFIFGIAINFRLKKIL
jgi:hypothetical protein